MMHRTTGYLTKPGSPRDLSAKLMDEASDMKVNPCMTAVIPTLIIVRPR